MVVEAKLDVLQRADGSASFSDNGFSVVAGVNGPVEVQRRDELAEEAALEVNIRPSIGLAGVRERHFESILQKALRHIIKVNAYPRTLIQVTLQVTATPENEFTTSRPPQAASNLSVLPALLNAAVLALLSSSIPLETTLTSTAFAILAENTIVRNPNPHAISRASSIHVLAFTASGHLLLVESEGNFDMKQWQEVAKIAGNACVEHSTIGADERGDITMQDEANSLGSTIRQAVEVKITQDGKWRKGIK